MTAQFARGPYSGRPTAAHQEPHAALLIDFDNVTMGIRSDLTKELKSLLNSDIIKGKVAVQRAYADWRRYPQYIVPLAEASVDLIFAPAYGSSKKNATDIRLAIDALELVFTRSEIGTFILLSGDSDFSSLVLKLKEYGKYVIGVGIRESASDLLVQNCDEYYSYSALTGLTRAGDSASGSRQDPWELVEVAVRQMTADGDVMRSDRLKQVILELDANFDEKTLGFSKFNRFVQEAANRGLLRLQKMENGQYEVALPTGEPAEAPRAEEERGDGRRRGRRGRGRREVEAQPAREGAGREDAPRPAARAEPVPPAPQPAPEREPEPVAAAPAAPEAAAAPAAAVPPQSGQGDLAPAYDLLRRAVAEVAADGGGVARDSDVKRRMLEIRKDWDESVHGFSKFSRFLRQAHDAEVINLRRLDNGNYEISVAGSAAAGREDATASGTEEPGGRRDRRGRRGERAAPRAGEARPARAAAPPVEVAAGPAPRGPATPSEVAQAPAARVAAAAAAKPSVRAAAPVTPPAAPGSRSLGLGLRRGSRGRPITEAPPPFLEGQTVGRGARGPAPVAAGVPAQPAADQPPLPETKRPRRGRGAADGRRTGAPQAAALDPVALGLPVEPDAVLDYLVASYKGVGRRSGEQLIEAFGAGEVFRALDTKPDRVKEILGARRGESLLEAWRADVAGRRAAAPVLATDAAGGEAPTLDDPPDGVSPTDTENGDDARGRRRGRRPRGRRGGRKRAASGSVED